MWCSYLAIIGGLSIYSSLNRMKFWDSTFRMGNQIVKGDNLLALQYVFCYGNIFLFHKCYVCNYGNYFIYFRILSFLFNWNWTNNKLTSQEK
jgi:hypothetical protein